jgi:hypothetical protein
MAMLGDDFVAAREPVKSKREEMYDGGRKMQAVKWLAQEMCLTKDRRSR